LSGTGRPLRDAALSGGVWSLAQIVANKGLSLVGTLALMYLLGPADYAVAGLALSLQAFLTFMPAFTLGDALLARVDDIDRLMGTALRICAVVSVATALMLVAAGPIASGVYEQRALGAACACIALRPLVELALLGPQTRLRVQLAFRELSIVDAACQAGATLAAIVMAAFGCGWVSLILPQIAFTGVRAGVYARSVGSPTTGLRWEPTELRALLTSYALSGFGQYVHGGLLMLPPLVIGWFGTNDEVGLFSMAFTLSASINVVVAVSIGLVLQPVFARMDGDEDRQASAFLRSCSTIAAVSMPLCLCQAAVVGPAIRVLLPGRWEGAETMAVLLSIGQAFYFAVNPAMSLLKAQGRFAAFLVWQGIQLAVVGAAMVAAAKAFPSGSAVAVTAVAALYTTLWSPIGVWLCIRRMPGAVARSVLLFARPAFAAAIAVFPGWLMLARFGGSGTAWDLTRLALLPILTLLMFPPLLRMTDRDTFNECAHVLHAIRARIRLNR
jgi:PST family polysaccharide transporter